MKDAVLKTELRTLLGTRRARRLRQEGIVPVTFGGKGIPTAHLQSAAGELEPVLRSGARLITLVHPGGKDRVFLKEVQYDHLGEKVYHVDFTKVAMDELIELDVDLVLKGKPTGVIEEGGTLDQYVRTLKVSCLPDAIPEKIEVEVSGMKLNDQLSLSAVHAPPGVKLLQSADMVLAAVVERKEEELAPAAAAEPGPTEPEVIKKERPAEEAAEEEKK